LDVAGIAAAGGMRRLRAGFRLTNYGDNCASVKKKCIRCEYMAASTQSRRRRASPPKRTGAQLVHEALRRDIMSLDLAPGAALDEGQLCRQFKVSRTPVREALIRLASEGLAELNPNRGAKVASIEFVDVVDHYEAMDIFMPVACHFAAVRRTPADAERLHELLARFQKAVADKDSSGMVRSNYELHSAIAAACHNRCIERGYRQMLADKLRLAQHGLPGTTYDRGHALADRFTGTARISARLVEAIEQRDAAAAEKLARQLNDFVRSQVIELLSASLGKHVEVRLPDAAR
jgi:DNA-binding GntR family transcriptional regulator